MWDRYGLMGIKGTGTRTLSPDPLNLRRTNSEELLFYEGLYSTRFVGQGPFMAHLRLLIIVERVDSGRYS